MIRGKADVGLAANVIIFHFSRSVCMKNNKLFIVGFLGSIFGVVALEAAPNFDIINKTDSNITVSVTGVKSAGGIGAKDLINLIPGTVVKPMGGRLFMAEHFSKSVDLNPYKSLDINITHNGQKKGYRIDCVHDERGNNSTTMYVTFGMKDGQFKLYPQTGPAGGLFGKTEAGYSLSKNVKASEITQK